MHTHAVQLPSQVSQSLQCSLSSLSHFHPHAPPPASCPAVFWSGVALYVGFLIYLILTPEGAQQLAATISRNVSYLSLRHGGSSSGASPARAGAAWSVATSGQQSAAASPAGSPSGASRALPAAGCARAGASLNEQEGVEKLAAVAGGNGNAGSH